jgi:uncharacterized protein YyaL (SSP411 family)
MKNMFLYSCAAVMGVMLMVSCSKEKSKPDTGKKPDTTNTGGTVSQYLTKAKQTREYAVNNLLTPFNSFIPNVGDPNSSFEWYNVSQIYADAAMIKNGDASYLTKMNATFKWMANMWDKNDPNGGYFGYAKPDGSNASGIKYVDDNSLSGMVYLEAYDVTTGADKAAYLDKAKACANWVIKSGLWDDTYGGGFWWNTEKKNKPTQTNGLAMQLFSRLYKITGETFYREWATSVNTWLTAKMYDASTGLYIWQYENGEKFSQKFTYDNAIMVEAFLLYGDATSAASYLGKAQALGEAMNKVLWDNTYNVYIFNTSDIRVTPAWCGWGTQAMIKLYEADENKAWLTYAKGNIDAINSVLRNTANNGYYQFAGLNGAGRYANIEGVDVAWMQRLQVMLSKYK